MNRVDKPSRPQLDPELVAVRTACDALLRSWLSDVQRHPDARVKLHALVQRALIQATALSLVTLHTPAGDDILIHGLRKQPISLRTLLAPSMGFDAYVSAEEPLRLVRERQRGTALIRRILTTFSRHGVAIVTLHRVADADTIDALGTALSTSAQSSATHIARTLQDRVTRWRGVGMHFEGTLPEGLRPAGQRVLEPVLLPEATLDVTTARELPSPVERAYGLARVALDLVRTKQLNEVLSLAEEALLAARICGPEADVVYACLLQVYMSLDADRDAAMVMAEALLQAHLQPTTQLQVASFTRLVAALFESPRRPAMIREALSKGLLSRDPKVWTTPQITPALVEMMLPLLAPDLPSSLSIARMVAAHPTPEVRISAVRQLSFDTDILRQTALGLLRDPVAAVRNTVVQRIGAQGDAKLSLYLVNHLRHGQAESAEEKRIAALELTRVHPARALPFLNAMLGPLAASIPSLLQRFKPLPSEQNLQFAALEALYHLQTTQARQILKAAADHGKRQPNSHLARQLCERLKSQPIPAYPVLPHSPLNPDFIESPPDLLTILAIEPTVETAEAQNSGERSGGLLGRLKKRLFHRDDAEIEHPNGDSTPAAEPSVIEVPITEAPEPVRAPEPDFQEMAPLPLPPEPGPARLRYEATLLDGVNPWSGTIEMIFALYDTPDGEPIWIEQHPAVNVNSGTVQLALGEVQVLPSMLPSEVWLGITIGGQEVSPRTRMVRPHSSL